MDKTGKDRNGLQLGKLENVGPLFLKFTSVHIKMSFTQLENQSQLLCGSDFENERLLLCQFDI